LRYDICALSGLVSVFGGGLTGIVLALSGAGVWSLVGQQLAGACAALVLLVLCSSWRPSFDLSRRHLRDLTGFANRVAMSDVLDFVGRRMDAPILGFFLSAHAIGLYYVAARLTFTVGMLTYYIIYDLCLAMLSRLQMSAQALRKGATMTLRLTTLFSLPTSIGLALVADPLVSLLFGPDWIEGALPL
jgi:PST family polysaccharide transporter